MATFLNSVHANTTSTKRINLFKDAVEAVDSAGDAIISLTDAFAHLIATGSKAYDVVSAKNDYNRLIDLSARSTNLVNLKNVVVVESIDDYLAKDNPSNYDWDSLKQGIQSVMGDVKLLLSDIKEERSDFVLEDAYSKMGKTLKSRSVILEKIAVLPKPNSKEELEQLGKLNEKYKKLIDSFSKATEQLNEYIKQSRDA